MIRTLWATAALLALFAMHGLAAHGTAHAPTPLAPTVAVALDQTHDRALDHALAHSPEHAADRAAAGHAAAPGAGSHGSDHGSDHGSGLLGLCLAVLLGAAVALLGLRRPRSGLLALLPHAADVPARPTRARGHHDPPDLVALSVQRC